MALDQAVVLRRPILEARALRDKLLDVALDVDVLVLRQFLEVCGSFSSLS